MEYMPTIEKIGKLFFEHTSLFGQGSVLMRERWLRYPIAIKFTVALTLVLLLLGATMGTALSIMSSRAHLEERRETLGVATRMLAIHLDEYMTRLLSELTFNASVLNTVSVDNRQTLLEKLIVQRPELQAVVFQSGDGQEISGGQWLGSKIDFGANGTGISPAEYIEGKHIFTATVQSDMGRIAAQVNLRELSLQQHMMDIQLGESGHPYLLDSRGIVLSHRYERFIGKNVSELVTMRDGRRSSVDLFTQASYSLLHYSMENINRIAGAVPLDRLGLVVGFSQSAEEVGQPVNRMLHVFLLSAVVLTLLMLGLGIYLSQLITNPVSTFVSQLEQIRDGHVLSVTGGGDGPEFGLARCAVNKLVVKLHDMSLAAVSTLILVLEARDSATKGHSKRVARISTLLAEAMGINGQSLRIIARAAMLHDVGKISVPDVILFKRECLDDQEREIIRQHPSVAKKILAPLAFLKEEIIIIEQHHEWVNGQGYPHGLTDHEIHPLAKILAVADAYEAMTADRPYRKAMTPSTAIRCLEEAIGIQFDKVAVHSLQEMMKQKYFTQFVDSGEVSMYGLSHETGA